MTERHTPQTPGRTIGWAAIVLAAAGLFGCASAPEKTDETSPTEAEAAPAPAHFGDDPAGTALAWADSPPDDLPETVADRLSAWSEPVLLRLLRTSDDEARAVVGEGDGKDQPAVLLHITRAEGTWSVTKVEPTTSHYGWPTM